MQKTIKNSAKKSLIFSQIRGGCSFKQPATKLAFSFILQKISQIERYTNQMIQTQNDTNTTTDKIPEQFAVQNKLLTK